MVEPNFNCHGYVEMDGQCRYFSLHPISQFVKRQLLNGFVMFGVQLGVDKN